MNAQTPEKLLIIPADGSGDANFGKSLSLHGDSMAVGAPGDNSAGFNAGAVYIYDFASEGWTERAKLVGSESGDKFGHSVDVFEDTLAVGAVNKLRIISGSVENQAGMVYVFQRSSNAWSESHQLVAADGEGYDHFGISVSLYQNTLLVGAADDNIDADTSSGEDLFGMTVIAFKVASVLAWCRVGVLVSPLVRCVSLSGERQSLC